VWARQQIGNQIGDLLHDCYSAAIVAFAELPSGGLAPARLRRLLITRRPPARTGS